MTNNLLPQRLFKITSNQKYSENLVQNGDIFVSPLAKFSGVDVEGNKRNDLLEGASHVLKAANIKENNIPVFYEGDNGQLIDISKYMVGDFIKFENNNSNLKIYCMYAFNLDEPEIDDKVFELGKYVGVIFDVAEFLRRIDIKISKINSERDSDNKVKFYYGNTIYVEHEKFHGYWNPFLKTSEYSYQKEFRIIILDPLFEEGSSEVFNIGSLEDISQWFFYKDIIE